MPGKPTIRWDEDTLKLILAARQQLVDEGMLKPTIRSTLYKLLKLPGWDKNHYDTLTVRLGRWRDDHTIPFGLFSDAGGGDARTPHTPREIAEQLAIWRNMVPATLHKDGYLRAVLVEHVGMVDQFSDFLDYGAAVVSSQGQLRREQLHSAVSKWVKVVEDLGGKGIKCIAVVDYDKGGTDIFEAHRRWLKQQFDIDMKLWAVTSKQVRDAGLPVHEDHQLDGWIAAYGVQRVKRELRETLGLPEAPPLRKKKAKKNV